MNGIQIFEQSQALKKIKIKIFVTIQSPKIA